MKPSMIALAMAALTASAAQAQPNLSDQEIQEGYRRAIQARMSYQPEQAEVILEGLVAARPNVPQLRFDLAVSQAEQGRCATASRTFSRGEDLAQTPSFARAAEIAMADLCPQLAPWETSLGFDLGYDTNVNGGAGESTIMVDGSEVTLSDDAVAKAAFGITASGQVAYNHRISQTSYVIPSISLTYKDYEGEDYDQLDATLGLSYRHRGDAVDWRIGPAYRLSFDRSGRVETGRGVVARATWTISSNEGLYLNASYFDVAHEENDLNDRSEVSFGGTYVRALEYRDMVARAGLSYSDHDYRNDLQDLTSITAQVGLSGSITPQIGFDVSLAHTWNEGSTAHPLFGVVREDQITKLNASASFARFEGWYGRPYIGVSHTISESSYDMKDYDRSAVTFGFTRRF